MDERKIALASRLMADREVFISEVCEAVGVSRSTLYRYLTADGVPRRRGGGAGMKPCDEAVRKEA